ncbi:MAG: hypothetical protein AAGN35_12270 [Bacteroidota bacterium]
MHVRRIILYLFLACIVAGCLGFVLVQFFGQYANGGTLVRYGFGIANLIGIIVLLAHASFYRTWTMAIIGPGLGVGLAGVAFKLMHWPNANEMMIACAGLVLIGYTIRFATKPTILLQDFLRWAWVSSGCLVTLGVVMFLIDPKWAYLHRVILVVTIVEFLLSERSFRDGPIQAQ